MNVEQYSSPITVHNVVLTINLGVTLWLPDVADKLKYVEYNPSRFSAVTFRLKHPKTTALLFSSGKLVCTGARNIFEATLACYKYVKCIREKVNAKASLYDLTVQNIVSSVHMYFAINLTKFHAKFANQCTYEMSLFPGAIWRDKKAKSALVVLIFKSGHLVITGAKRKEELEDTFLRIFPKLLECKQIKDENEAGDPFDDKEQATINNLVNELIEDYDI